MYTVSYCLIYLLWLGANAQDPYPFVQISDCVAGEEFFNSANQECQSCNNWMNLTVPATNSLECICSRPDYQQITRLPAAIGGPFPFTCNQCPMGTVTSSDGTECIRCSASTTSNSEGCQCIDPLSEALVERDQNGTILDSAFCIPCVDSTTPVSQSTGCVDTGNPCTAATSTTSVSLANCGCAFTAAPNITACEALANLCVMDLYNLAQPACENYKTLFDQPGRGIVGGNAAWKFNLPWIYYDEPDNQPTTAGAVISFTGITTSFGFRGGTTVFDFVVLKYDFDGTYLGYESATTGILQICEDRPTVKSAAFTFGTSYQRSCTLSAAQLMDSDNYPDQLYELNLRYTEAGSNTQFLYPIPVLIPDVDTDNIGLDIDSWVFVKRFFLVDRLSDSVSTTSTIRYASSLLLTVQLQDGTTEGRINPPVLRIDYVTIDRTTGSGSASFVVSYSMGMSRQNRAFIISLSILGALGVLYALFETSGWRRRQGLQFIEGSSLIMFIYFCMAMLANVFFIVMFGYSIITLFFFKGQQTVTTLLPNEDQRRNFVIFTSLALAFKIVQILGMIVLQSISDIFLIDWERPANNTDNKISIWRTYFIANEWNEIQTVRKVHFTLQLFIVILFLEVIGFKSLALENPSGSLSQASSTSPDLYIPVYNPVLRFAIGGLVYTIAAVVQVIYQILIHERFFHDKIREFIDLCSVANISVFILSNRHFGYYIHGRSPHGKADTDMVEMNNMLKKEEDDLVGGRGLESGSEQQAFQVSIPLRFRLQYDKIYQPLELIKNQPSARGVNTSAGSMVTESFRAYTTMRNFLCSFLDHSLRDLDYYVKDSMLLETLTDMEFQEPIDAAYFYNDPRNSFTNTLFYGREFALTVFEILLFTIIDYHIFDYLLAAIITFIIVKFLEYIRQALGRQNLAKKTLVDKRFLI